MEIKKLLKFDKTYFEKTKQNGKKVVIIQNYHI